MGQKKKKKRKKVLLAPCILVQGNSTSQRENATMGEESSCQMGGKHEYLLGLPS